MTTEISTLTRSLLPRTSNQHDLNIETEPRVNTLVTSNKHDPIASVENKILMTKIKYDSFLLSSIQLIIINRVHNMLLVKTVIMTYIYIG